MVPGAGEEYNEDMPSYGATTVRVYLVDDHHIVSRTCKGPLASGHDIEVGGHFTARPSASAKVIGSALADDEMRSTAVLQHGDRDRGRCRRVRSRRSVEACGGVRSG